MKRVLIQNHPGNVRFSFNGWEIFNSNLSLAIQADRRLLLCKGCFYLFGIFFALLLFAAVTANHLSVKGAITGGCAFVYLLMMAGLIVWIGRRAKAEQLHYYQANGIEPLSEEKLQALQLIAPLRFEKNQWSETLEFWPRKPEAAKDHYHYRVLRFDSLYKIGERREILEELWGIGDRESYIGLMEYFITGESASHFFESEMKERAEEIISLLNKFDKFEPDYIYDCTVRRFNQTSARLIWALEIVRAIGLTSSAYQNGLIEEELAWKYILLMSKKAHDLFESEEAFHRNYKMGSLYWHACCYRRKLADVELEAIYRYEKQVWEGYMKNCRWPIRNIPWKSESQK